MIKWRDKAIHVATCSDECITYASSRVVVHHTICQRQVNVQYLTSPEKRKRYTGLRTRLESVNKECKQLKETLQFFTESRGLKLQSDLHADFATIMKEMSEKVHKTTRRGPFAVFWGPANESPL